MDHMLFVISAPSEDRERQKCFGKLVLYYFFFHVLVISILGFLETQKASAVFKLTRKMFCGTPLVISMDEK